MCVTSGPHTYYIFKYIYCDMSTHCWVAQQGLLGSRPVNNSRPNTRYATTGEAVSSPCRAVPSRTAPCVATQHVAMTSHATGVGEYRVTFAFPRVTQHSSHLARYCSDACTIEGFIRGTGMSKKELLSSSSRVELLSSSLKK
jgi:hypothetical protein